MLSDAQAGASTKPAGVTMYLVSGSGGRCSSFRVDALGVTGLKKLDMAEHGALQNRTGAQKLSRISDGPRFALLVGVPHPLPAPTSPPRSLIVAALMVLAPACDGVIGETPPGQDRENEEDEEGIERCNSAPSPMRRLNQREMGNVLADAFVGASLPDTHLVAEQWPHGFDNDIHTLEVSETFARSFHTFAIDVARSVQPQLSSISPCTDNSAECAAEFSAAIAQRLFRRPADELALSGIQSLFTGRDFEVGASLAIEAMIQSPEFLWRVETAPPGDDPVALANRLSFFLWGTGPDAELIAAATGGELGSAEQVRAQAERMIDDPRADTQLRLFFSMWLGLRQDGQTLSPLDEEVLQETESFALNVLRNGGTVSDLYLSTETDASESVADLYANDPAPGMRAGILSRAGFLRATSKIDDTSPVLRGVRVLERVLCAELGPPPADADATPLPDLGPEATRRQRVEAQTQDAACASCHNTINPIGFALERFDRTGAYRELDVYTGTPIDTRGWLPSGQEFADEQDLFEFIASAEGSAECLTENMVRFAFGGGPASEDHCFLDELNQEFADSGHILRELVLAIVTHPRFRQEL